MRVKRAIFLFLSVLLLCTVLLAQEGDNGSAENISPSHRKASMNPGSTTNLTDFNNIWEITKMAGPFRWAIFIVLFFGMGSIIYKYAELIMDNWKARPIYQLDLNVASLQEIEEAVNKNPNNLVNKLFSNMLNIFQTTERAEDFHYEITNFDQIQQDKFATFQGKMSFLSDTAGALGLLGTVWGMFVTFSRGILDNQIILTGMGLALVTTLMGLVTSIILNFFSTQIQGFFRRNIDQLLEKGDQLRLQLLRTQRKNPKKVMSRRFDDYIEIKDNIPNDQAENKQQGSIEDSSFEEEPEIEQQGANYKIRNVSGDNQMAVVNCKLKSPFTVLVLNGDEKGVPGQPVVFSIEKGTGTFLNGNKCEEIKTDSTGQAMSTLILGNNAGENVVRANLKRNMDEYVRFRAEGRPASPTQLKYISGNLQNSPAGQELREPFVVKLEDNYNNPIVDHQVIFKVKIGKGYFPGNKKTYVTKTDKKGLAQSYFTLRPEPGFNSINVYAKGLRRNKIEFEALGQ